MPERHVVLRHRERHGIHELASYRETGGYEQLRRCVAELSPDQVTDVVRASGLRGRGGAGYPTAAKWSFVPVAVSPRYVVVNNDESEPGTFKDRELTRRNPHQVLEGAAIAAFAVGAERVFVYCRGEFWHEAAQLRQAVADAEVAGCLGDGIFGSRTNVRVTVSLGAGAYICGEETALLESLEGQRGQPRLKPPYPAAVGLYGKPTVVNNTETLANLPPILAHGADWYRAIGTEGSPGTKVFSISGHVERPGNYEAPLGTPFAELLAMAGGVWHGRRLKAVLPSGASAPVMPADVVTDLPMDWESVAAAGSLLGSASLIVLDDTTDMVWVADLTTRFFEHESCGKCSPCREGTFWMGRLYERLRDGRAQGPDVVILEDVIRLIRGKCLCPLGEFSLCVPSSTLEHYRSEYDARVASARGEMRG